LFGPDGIFTPGTEVLLIDLPTALRIANGANPTIAFARARIDEAYVRVEQAQLMWLPNLDMGLIYLRHDGNLQNAAGLIFPTSKSSLTLFGGPSLQVATADALFAPLIARRLAEAQQANTRAVTNDIQLNVVTAYLDLLQAYAQLAINADILARDQEVLRRAEVADRTQLAKTGADLPRIQTEYQLRVQERITIRGQIRVASSRLARLLLLQPTVGLVPADPALAPITLIPEDGPIDQLIGQALMNRPELAESRALISASEVRLRQARLRPLLPNLELTYYGADFGGGRDDSLAQFRGRSDGTAAAVWTLQNMGLGNLAETRLRRIQTNEANLHALEVQAQVTDEVNQAIQVALARREALASGQEAIRKAVEMFRRLDIIAFGMNGPKKELESLEPLLAIQALAQARTLYLNYVIDYNRAQFQLFAAVGSPPLEAPAKSPVVPIEVSPVPTSYVAPK
jgi:outer membrane protein TolC